MDKPRLNSATMVPSEFLTIRLWIENRLADCDEAIDRFRQIMEIHSGAYAAKQISYWNHARNNLTWQLGILAQMETEYRKRG